MKNIQQFFKNEVVLVLGGLFDMARSIWLLILIKNIYTLYGRKRFLLPVTYFLSNLVNPLL